MLVGTESNLLTWDEVVATIRRKGYVRVVPHDDTRYRKVFLLTGGLFAAIKHHPTGRFEVEYHKGSCPCLNRGA